MAEGGSHSVTAIDAKPTLRTRFKSWWDGGEPASCADGSESPYGADPGQGMREVAERAPEETARLRLVQEVFGPGFSTPGGAAYVHDLVKPFAPDPSMRVLDLGAGLGGATRAMARRFGVQVVGLEADPVFAEAGMALSAEAGLSHKAPIVAFDPATFDQRPQSFDRVLSKEFLYSVDNKPAILRAVANALRVRGQVIFTDYVLPAPGSRAPSRRTRSDAEPNAPDLWTLEKYRSFLASLRLRVQYAGDITAEHHRIVSQSWADYMLKAKRTDLEDGPADALVGEVERWSRRLQAIERGDLTVCCVHAEKQRPVRAVLGR